MGPVCIILENDFNYRNLELVADIRMYLRFHSRIPDHRSLFITVTCSSFLSGLQAADNKFAVRKPM